MAKVAIVNKAGKQTRYFWLDKDGADRTKTTVYKQTTEGVKRMKGVHYDATRNAMVKH